MARLATSEWVHVQCDQNHMATTFSFKISCPVLRAKAAESVLTEAHAIVASLEEELSEFRQKSAVYRLNQSKKNERIFAPRSLVDLLNRSQRLARQTQYAFDPTVKSRVSGNLCTRLVWDTTSVWKTSDDVHLGFGAIGKGYALDQVRSLIEREGFHSFVLSAGGSSIILSGEAMPGEAWDFGWSWQKDSNGNSLGIPIKHSSTLPKAIGVSGLHEKGNHLIGLNPHKATLQSALVASDSATDADALSTALFVSGWDRGQEWVQPMLKPVATAVIDSQGVPRWNGIFQSLWGALGGFLIFTTMAVGQEQAINLDDLGVEDFQPYRIERDPLWIVPAVFIFIMVLLHLRKPKRKAKPQ